MEERENKKGEVEDDLINSNQVLKWNWRELIEFTPWNVISSRWAVDDNDATDDQDDNNFLENIFLSWLDANNNCLIFIFWLIYNFWQQHNFY